eukprot:Seg1734.6 transcript_id=Seg1734.6/GoldUCD/mRNA.D3Y31 product="E3 ubiquitin-protein ligase RNF181" protein_id=Seg1734.6/GoldUCD/D3Y31
MASYFDEHHNGSISEDEERMNFLLELARLLHRVLREQNVQIDLPIEEMLAEHLTTPPAARDFIANLPTVKLISEKCPICLAEFHQDEVNKKLPCKHCFHGECIIPWLKKTNSCPVCRKEFPTDNPAYEEYRKELERENNADRVHRLEELHETNLLMARQDLLLFGGICTAIGLALLPIYVYPKMTSNSYNKMQEDVRKGKSKEETQPGGMKVWSDPFDRNKEQGKKID